MLLSKLPLIGLTVLVVVSACSSPKNMAGSYASNFPVIGYNGTRLNLNIDSTFTYRMRGHMTSDTATGRYAVMNRFLVLSYDPSIIDTILNAKYVNEAVVISQPLTGWSNRPTRFYVGRNKLFYSDSSGQVYRRKYGISKHKKFLIFGDRYMKKRKHYLIRIEQ